MAAVDWDSDGLVDLLVGVHDLEGYWPDAERLPPTQVVGLNQRAGHPGYDRQGLWRGRAPVGRVYWLRNVGRPGEPRFELQPEIKGESGPLDLGLHPAPLAVAWGGRGNLELLVSDERGLCGSTAISAASVPPCSWSRAPCNAAAPPCCFTTTGPPSRPATSTATGEPSWSTARRAATSTACMTGRRGMRPGTRHLVLHRTEEISLGGHASIAVCDLDADGDLDIVYGDAVGRLHFLEDMGSGDDHRYAPPVTIEAGGAPFRIEPGPDGMLPGPRATASVLPVPRSPTGWGTAGPT